MIFYGAYILFPFQVAVHHAIFALTVFVFIEGDKGQIAQWMDLIIYFNVFFAFLSRSDPLEDFGNEKSGVEHFTS